MRCTKIHFLWLTFVSEDLPRFFSRGDKMRLGNWRVGFVVPCIAVISFFTPSNVTSLSTEELGVALGLPQTEKASSTSCASASNTDDRDSPQGNILIIIHHSFILNTPCFVANTCIITQNSKTYSNGGKLQREGVFISNEIQPVTEIRSDIILYWRIEFWRKLIILV